MLRSCCGAPDGRAPPSSAPNTFSSAPRSCARCDSQSSGLRGPPPPGEAVALERPLDWRHASRQDSITAERPRPVRQCTATTLSGSALSQALMETHASTNISNGGQRWPENFSVTTCLPNGSVSRRAAHAAHPRAPRCARARESPSTESGSPAGRRRSWTSLVCLPRSSGAVRCLRRWIDTRLSAAQPRGARATPSRSPSSIFANDDTRPTFVIAAPVRGC
eukprot:scaffold52663_cov65-Phaeocystis_antarctica.AAC.6